MDRKCNLKIADFGLALFHPPLLSRPLNSLTPPPVPSSPPTQTKSLFTGNAALPIPFADFDGSVGSTHGALRPSLTGGVGSLWYSAPELLWGSTAYDTGVDVWAAGSEQVGAAGDDRRDPRPSCLPGDA
uniref:Cyclin-dependent kinase 2 homolog n=1 Tax=Chromera velia CCMP2878 TaxID=1169474 RepID=A0A0G4H9Q5_9ALVE|eukprot:Cvel_25482.t1-p1 / transcript=Cvel_25482.t1 / gene=Cvel_25482 / organism=Chromera_velia_CCMP2878 / gene_product=hypothetical protein / transcript_product=hypothetical protein / location=Cvel_scaffold2894:4963-5616(-) / protein_length=128 / sequence_SO=supercontig / SO=protein_coding / is_pseudo=false